MPPRKSIKIEDSEARELAMEAKSQLSSHEKLCTERWEQSRSLMTEMREDVKSLLASHERQSGAINITRVAVPMIWTVFVAVIAALAWLVVRYAPHT